MVSIWEKETFFAPQDVIVIGSGFVGLWSALWLVKENPRLRVTVIDRGLIPTGASTRNAGFACFGSLSELAYDIKTMGTEKTLELVELRYRGLERIQKYFKPGKIDFERCGGYELFTDCQGMESSSLQQQMDYLNALLREITGAKRTYRLADTENDRFGFAGVRHLVLNKGEGYLHSGKLLRALLREVHARGVQVLNRVEVLGYERSQKGFRVHTNSEAPLETEQILICTNAFAKDLLPEADIVPARGQVLLTSPIEGLPWKGTFHYDEGFYYFRNLGNRVLLGGARNSAFEAERTHEMTTTENIQSELERFLDTCILPEYRGQYTIEHRWSGIMAMGSEKMPIMSEIEPGVFCAVRMSGMGVALAPVVGEKIARQMR